MCLCECLTDFCSCRTGSVSVTRSNALAGAADSITGCKQSEVEEKSRERFRPTMTVKVQRTLEDIFTTWFRLISDKVQTNLADFFHDPNDADVCRQGFYRSCVQTRSDEETERDTKQQQDVGLTESRKHHRCKDAEQRAENNSCLLNIHQRCHLLFNI